MLYWSTSQCALLHLDHDHSKIFFLEVDGGENPPPDFIDEAALEAKYYKYITVKYLQSCVQLH
jgi:hypothetical protein